MKNITLKSVCFILIILTAFASVTGGVFIKTALKDKSDDTSANHEKGLESGFGASGGGASSPFLCAYKSDKTEFDINDVTLDFYYGVYFLESEEDARESTFDYPSFDLYFAKDERNKVLIRHVEENFISEKYRCDFVYEENWKISEIKYNHFETLTIPKEMFTEDKGAIYFEIHSTNIKDYAKEYRSIVGKVIYYALSLSEDRVILTDNYYIYKSVFGGK